MPLSERIKNNRVVRLLMQAPNQEKGSALIVALLVTLVLVLLGLSLMLQSDTETSISVNERESFQSLQIAEMGVQWAKSYVLKQSHDATTFSDFSSVLAGPDGIPATTADNHMLGLGDLGASHGGSCTSTDLTSADENQTPPHSCVETIDFNGNGTTEQFEVLRVGFSDPSDGGSTGGQRHGLLYLRIDDNHDDAPAADDDLTDVDRRVVVRVLAKFPIPVDSTGTMLTGTSVPATFRGTSIRKLVAKFAPNESIPAIATEKSINVQGNSMTVCGECGSVYANLNLNLGGDICQNATSAGATNTGATVNGDRTSGADTIFIPDGNAYDPIFVPKVSSFVHSDFLNCPAATTGDPGTTKYYALVMTDDNRPWVYKAYPDFNGTVTGSANNWVWRLIDDLSDGNDTKLDDCGRVVSGQVPDPNSGAGLTALTPDCGPTSPYPSVTCSGATGVPDAGASSFYGFTPPNNHGTTWVCPDETLGTTSHNDANKVAFKMYGVAGPNGSVLTNSNANVTFPLPGGTRTGNGANKDGDGVPDYDIDKNFENTVWGAGGGYSPVFNGIVFVYGGLDIPNTGSLVTSSGTVAAPDDFYRTSMLAYGSVNGAGNGRYAAANNFDYFFVFIAGRDIRATGNAISKSQNTCAKSSDLPGQCNATPDSSGYEGIYVAHEQINFDGDVAIDGFMRSKGAANCSDTAKADDLVIKGNPSIHYGCQPPDPWAGKSVKMTGWEEIQN